jgi:polyferredoxin
MSSIAVTASATGTGTVSLVAPVTNSDRTITLPDVTGTVAVQGGAGVGKVLQVVSTTTATQTSSTTSSYADTAITLNITPTSATSKILVTVYCGMCTKTANDTQLNIRLVRGATTAFDAAALNQSASALLATNPTLVYYDSPATTSSTTYKIQIANRDSAGTVILNNNGTATITLMEIAA